MPAVARCRFFGRMREAAEQARGEKNFLLRRQALYLGPWNGDGLMAHLVRETLRGHLPVMLDDSRLSPQARRELEGIRYAIRLAEA